LFPGKSSLVRWTVDDSLDGVDASSSRALKHDHGRLIRMLKPHSAHKLRQRLRQADKGLDWKSLALSCKLSP
jgi:hypothetical protein